MLSARSPHFLSTSRHLRLLAAPFRVLPLSSIAHCRHFPLKKRTLTPTLAQHVTPSMNSLFARVLIEFVPMIPFFKMVLPTMVAPHRIKRAA